VSDSKKIEKLASQILYHKRLYYKGTSELTNEQFDALEEQLKKLSPHHPVLHFVGYELADQKGKIKHDPPMLSLAKTYEKSVLLDFLNQFDCVAMDKFDGMALCVEYNEFGEFVQASTRGNGEFGENVTEHVYHIAAIPKVLKLPHALLKHRIEIRGEIYFPLSEFKKYEKLFDSFRNAVPGTLGRKDVNEAKDILNTFLFCPFDLLIFNLKNQPLNAADLAKLCHFEPVYLQKFSFIQKLGFDLQEDFLFKIKHASYELKEPELDLILEKLYAKKRDHEIDGLVFRIEDDTIWEKLGNTAHHPRGSLAFKRAGETAITEILAIEPNVGRSGKISFRAKLAPVFLSSAKISHATLHNAEYIEKGNYDVGAKVKIIRSGEVIPAILTRVDGKKGYYQLPKYCLCHAPLERRGPDLWCTKFGHCEFSHHESLVHFVSVMKMHGISDKIIAKFCDAGLLKEPADLYTLSAEDILELEGFGQKSAQNIIQAIKERTQVPLWQFLTALSLRRGGEVKCRGIARKFKTLDNVLHLNEKDLLDADGWAEKSIHDFIQSLHEKREIIKNLRAHVNVESDHTDMDNAENAVLSGKRICITGALSVPRAEIKLTLERLGAKIVSSVSHNTDILVCNEASDSSKYKDAKRYNVQIVTEHELMQHIQTILKK
jgi:DNA ligase (NAD+)